MILLHDNLAEVHSLSYLWTVLKGFLSFHECISYKSNRNGALWQYIKRSPLDATSVCINSNATMLTNHWQAHMWVCIYLERYTNSP